MVKLVFTIGLIIPLLQDFIDNLLDIYYLQEVNDNADKYLNAPSSVYRTIVAFIFLGLFKIMFTCSFFVAMVFDAADDWNFDDDSITRDWHPVLRFNRRSGKSGRFFSGSVFSGSSGKYANGYGPLVRFRLNRVPIPVRNDFFRNR